MTGNPTDAMVCDTPSLQNEFGDPGFGFFFTFLISFDHFLPVRGKFLGANVLK